MQSTFSVIGMTCDHCEKRVSDEVSQIPGVVSASADHLAATVIVSSEAELDRDLILAAVEEAGYALADG